MPQGGYALPQNPIPPPGLRREQAENTIKNMQEASPSRPAGPEKVRPHTQNTLGGKNDGMFFSYRR